MKRSEHGFSLLSTLVAMAILMVLAMWRTELFSSLFAIANPYSAMSMMARIESRNAGAHNYGTPQELSDRFAEMNVLPRLCAKRQPFGMCYRVQDTTCVSFMAKASARCHAEIFRKGSPLNLRLAKLYESDGSIHRMDGMQMVAALLVECAGLSYDATYRKQRDESKDPKTCNQIFKFADGQKKGKG